MKKKIVMVFVLIGMICIIGIVIVVTSGANKSLGTSLVHGPGATLHISVISGETRYCPYTYFSPAAKAAFEAQFWLVNYSSYGCM